MTTALGQANFQVGRGGKDCEVLSCIAVRCISMPVMWLTLSGSMRAGDKIGGWLCMGVQELRRRCAVGHCGAGLWLARPHDQRPPDARWQSARV